MGEIATRIKGSAVPVKGGWGWKLNIFMNEEASGEPITMRNGDDDICQKREDAVKHMKSHIAGIQEAMAKGFDDLEEKMKDPNWKPEVKKEEFRKAKDTALVYEDFVTKIYTKHFWEGVKVHARYDFKYKKLEKYLMDERPEPNILLITGLDNEPFEFKPSEAPHLLDLPFKTCVIEATDKTLFNMNADGLPAGSSDIQTLLVTEINGVYGFLGMTEEGDISWSTDPESDAYKLYMTVTKSFCNFINSKMAKVGRSKTNIRFKHKKTGLVKIKKLIHISKQVKGNPTCPGSSFQVDWSHRWEVRGHWRSIGGMNRLGKDRNGDYKIKGFTWVQSHTKGPEEKELMKKVRKVGE